MIEPFPRVPVTHLDEQTFWAADSFVERTRSDAIQNEGFVSPGQLPPQAVLDGLEPFPQNRNLARKIFTKKYLMFGAES